MRIHFVANVHRPDAMDAAFQAAQWIQKQKHEVAVEPETGRYVALPVVAAESFAEADLVVAFGGDGTLIRAAHLCSERGTPILGVYFGRFGFVTQCPPEEVRTCLEQVIRGGGSIESRMMLEVSLVRDGQTVATIHALNEAVLQRSTSARMMTFKVTVDGCTLTTYPADGVIVSTPTGSTAYNLSAGGPIVDPLVQVFLLTAIAPHTLASRPLVLSPSSVIHLAMLGTVGDSILSADGQTRLHILDGDEVLVRRSQRVTNLVTTQAQDFMSKLGSRLFWNVGIFSDE